MWVNLGFVGIGLVFGYVAGYAIGVRSYANELGRIIANYAPDEGRAMFKALNINMPKPQPYPKKLKRAPKVHDDTAAWRKENNLDLKDE